MRFDVGAIKKPARAGFFVKRKPTFSAERLDVRAETAFMTRRFVLVDQAAAGIAIHDRLGRLVRSLRRRFVFRFDRIDDLLDRRTQHRARAGIACIALHRLTCALFGGFDIGQGKTPEIRGKGEESRDAKRALIVRIAPVCVNENHDFSAIGAP